ncbi:hypothetical protein NX059_002201 [Plenodomus lindquistii]|nr:hypothetical protein NX059_002201 [Plenodomus lindquistii]
MMGEDEKKDCKNVAVTISSIGCATPTEDQPPPPPYRRTWANDSVPVEETRRNWGSFWIPKSRWTWGVTEKWNAISKGTLKETGNALKTCYTCLRDATQLVFKNLRFTRRQCFALLLLLVVGFLPMIILGFLASDAGHAPYYQVFSDKIMSCGNSLGAPQNSTVSGIEKLFVLDTTWGRFSFAAVKTIDVAWDLFVGRGVQICASWAAYKVFSDALLFVIERNPASFRIFQRIALEGPNLHSLWTLTQELFTRNDTRTKLLFIYMFVSISYVLTVPIFLGAMTGYDSTNIAWIDLDNSNNIVPASMLKSSTIVSGTRNHSWDQAVCLDNAIANEANNRDVARHGRCDCRLIDSGIMVFAKDYWRQYYSATGEICTYNFMNNTQTYKWEAQNGVDYGYDAQRSPEMRNCNATMDVEVNGKKYEYLDLTVTGGYCYESTPYNYSYLFDKTRCLPDTANPSYEWGFATMMSGIFVFITFGWCTSMYIVWQHAQFNSTLVKSGYAMTPLRAAFAMAKAAKKKTGMGERQLIRAYTKDLENELYGGCGVKATSMEYGLFVEDPEEGDEDRTYLSVREVRARHVRGLSEASAGG